MSAQPTWIILAPMVLLLLLAGASFGGFLLLKWLRAQPHASGVVTGLTLLGFGFVGFVMLSALGLLIAVLVVGVSRDHVVAQPATPAEPRMVHIPSGAEIHLDTEIQQRVDAELEAHGIGRASPLDSVPSYSPHHTDTATERVPTVAVKVGFMSFAGVVLVAVTLGAFVLLKTLASNRRLTAGAVIGVVAAAGLASLVGGLFVVRTQTYHVVAERDMAAREKHRAIAEELRTRTMTLRPLLPAPVPDKPAEPPVSALLASQTALTPLPTDDRSTVEPESFTPSWVRAGVQRKGDVTTVVCSSQQFASVPEADADARAAVRDYLLGERLRTIPKESFGPRTAPSVDGLVDGVVKDRYVETIQRDFGTFFAPMHRVWLKAEVTPTTYNQMRAAYTAELQKSRLLVAGGALAALLCVPLGIITCGRLDRWTNHRFPRILQAGIGAAVLGLWGLGAAVLERFVTLF